MSTALKCDRCHNYFDYDPSAKFNFIAYGHKDIVVGKNFPVKDICPHCMEQFMNWFENSDNYDPHDLVKNINVTDCADRSNGATEKEFELASKLNDAKIYIAQLKLKLGYTMSKEEMNILEEEKKNEQN